MHTTDSNMTCCQHLLSHDLMALKKSDYSDYYKQKLKWKMVLLITEHESIQRLQTS